MVTLLSFSLGGSVDVVAVVGAVVVRLGIALRAGDNLSFMNPYCKLQTVKLEHGLRMIRAGTPFSIVFGAGCSNFSGVHCRSS